MAVTRIKNNQITDNTIEYPKIKDGTLVGTKFNSNITLNSNVTIIGNLQVSGNTTTVNSIDTLVSDPLITLNNGYVGTPSYDVGILFNRALGTLDNYGGVNSALVWSESDGAFIVVLTTETGTTQGTIGRQFKANLIAGNIAAANLITAETARFTTLQASNFNTINVLSASGNLVANAGTTSPIGVYTEGAVVVTDEGGVAIGGNLNVRGLSNFNGNITAGNISITGNINAIVGAVASQYGVFYGDENGHRALYAGVTDYTQLPTAILQITGNVDSYSQLNLQNVNNGAYASGDIVVTADDGTDTTKYIDLGIAGSGYDYPGYEILKPHDGYLNVATGNLVFYLFDPNKNMYFYTGGTTTTSEPGFNTTFPQMTLEDGVGTLIQPTTSSVNRTTGALRVDGGLGVRGNIHAAAINSTPIGNTNPSTGVFTNIDTSTFSAGNIATSGNIVSSGNIVARSGTASTNTTTGALVVIGGTGISGDTNTGGNVNIAGQFISTQAGSPVDGQGQVFLNGATSNRIDWAAVGTGAPVFTARSAGTKLLLYPSLTGSTTDYAVGIDAATLWSSVPENTSSFKFKWYGATTEVASLTGTGILTVTGNIHAASTTESTSATTGALVVSGGAGIVGNLNVAGNTVIQGNLTVQGDITSLNVATLDVEDLNITVAKGALNSAAANGAGLTVDGAGATITYASLDDSWNFNKKVNLGIVVLSNLNVTAANITTLVAANFSSPNVWISGGNVNGLSDLTATTTQTSNFSSPNVWIAGGNINSISDLTATTTQTSNFSSPNVWIAGGNINGLANLSATITQTNNFSSPNVWIAGGNINNLANLTATTTWTTNFSSGNAWITGGYADGFVLGANVAAPATFTTANITTINSGTSTIVTMNATNGNITTLYAGNFSTGNAWITGGYADGFAIGANVPAPGSFTTLTTTSALASSGNLVITSGTINPTGSTTAGALILTGEGGAAIGGNVTVMGGMIINHSQLDTAGHSTIVQGVNDSTLFYAAPGTVYDQVAIGGNMAGSSLTLGAKLAVYSNDSFLLPVGASATRPSNLGFTDVNGMIRYSSTKHDIEYYVEGEWKNMGNVFTTITQRTFQSVSGDPNGNIDGVNDTFVLPTASTTNATLVSINGVMQIPSIAYNVTGTSLVFTEPPSLDDVIDTRVMVTTQAITTLAGPNGYNQVDANNNYISFYTGNLLLGSVENWRIDSIGDFYPVQKANIGNSAHHVGNIYLANIHQTGTTTISSTKTFIAPNDTGMVDRISKDTFSSGKVLVELSETSGTHFQSSELVVVHNGTVANVTAMSSWTSAANLATFSANISGAYVYINASSAGANLTVKTQATLFRINNI
jgi:hypothetical protein